MTVVKQIETAVLIDDDEVYLMLCERVIKRSGLVKNVLIFKMHSDFSKRKNG